MRCFVCKEKSGGVPSGTADGRPLVRCPRCGTDQRGGRIGNGSPAAGPKSDWQLTRPELASPRKLLWELRAAATGALAPGAVCNPRGWTEEEVVALVQVETVATVDPDAARVLAAEVEDRAGTRWLGTHWAPVEAAATDDGVTP